VLQEVAAARHIVIMCGSTTIDGYAFCLGVKSLKLFSTDSPALQTLGSVVYLIERAGLRLKYTANLPGSFSLEIRSLAELIDMFHSRQATDPRDKVYALLGMSSDDPEKGMLQPDYDISWEELFQQVVKFVLGKNISMETSCQRTAIKCRGWILGKIYSVRREDRQYVTIKHNNSVRRQIGHDTEWTLQASAQPIQKFDIICLLYGALKPTIIRLCRDYFTVVVIAATPLNESSSFDWRKLSQSTTLFLRDVLLTWDWGNAYGKLQEEEEYETSTKTHSQAPVCSKADARGYLSEAARLWNVIAIFDDLGDFAKADEMILEARSNYIAAFGEDKPHVSSFRNTRTLLSSAAAEGNEDIIRLLLEQLDTVDLDIKDKEFRRSALWWAVNHGHEGVAKLLLETGKVEADSKDSFGQTPLSRAAENGHEAIVKLLLETGKVEADSKNNYGHTPLLWAAENGHEAIVKLLLDTGKVDVDLKDTVGYTPLCYAVSKGYEAVVDLLLKTGKVDIHAQTRWGRTPLSIAIDYKEHSKAIYELLLEASKAETSKVDAESKDEFGQTLFRRAIMKGQKAVANILPGWFWKDKETEG
jgi:ankyrin repeat protein